MTTIAIPQATRRRRLDGDAVVLVDGVLNGQPFKPACAELGLPVVGVYTIERRTLQQMAPGHADGDAATVYGSDPDALAGRVAELTGRVRAVVPATEPAVYCAALLADRCGVPGNPAGTALARRDKRAMRRLAADRGIRVPRHESVRDVRDIPPAAARTGLPVIVKPATGAGSHNVFLVRSPAGLAPIATADRHDLFGGRIDEWLVEEYVRGREFAVNTFSFGGMHRIVDVWEYRLPDTGDYDNPYWDFVQAEDGDPDRAAAVELALRVLDAFEIELGPCHVEVKVDQGEGVLIEIGARLPGAGIPGLWQRYGSLRPYHDTLAAHLGRRPEVLAAPPRFTGRLGMCFIRNDGPPGTLRRLDGLARVRRMPGVVEVITTAAPGDPVPTTRSLGTELAKVRMCAPSGPALTELISRVRATLTAEVDPARWTELPA
jgi:biotin carboxylase